MDGKVPIPPEFRLRERHLAALEARSIAHPARTATGNKGVFKEKLRGSFPCLAYLSGSDIREINLVAGEAASENTKQHPGRGRKLCMDVLYSFFDSGCCSTATPYTIQCTTAAANASRLAN
jgi:hypothetical protein